MQSFLDSSGPPLSSPSGIFNFDGLDNGNGNGNGEDLFRYYLDLQAFQGKEKDNNGAMNMNMMGNQQQPSYPSWSNGNSMDGSSMLSMMNMNTDHLAPSTTSSSSASSTSLSPYNAFFINPQQQASTGTGTGASNSAAASAALFPFAEAASSAPANTFSSYNSTTNNQTVNPASLLSFDHLAGSANPQPIDPSFLMGNNNNNNQQQQQQTAIPMSSIIPQVKIEEDSNEMTAFHPPSSMTMTHPATSMSSSSRHRRSNSRRSEAQNSDEEEEDEEQEEEDDDDDDENMEDEEGSEEEALAATLSNNNNNNKKRNAAATTAASNNGATNGKKRSAATKNTSANKKSTSSSASRQSKKESSVVSSSGGHPQHPHALVPVPEWADRPSKEVYEKLSSKEKRQMRNKISARNFRHRRKAHIDTLEALVEEKEGVIAVLHEEVGTLRTENQGLRADIEVLKKNWESIAAKIGASTISHSAPVASISSAQQQQQQIHLTPEEDDLYGAPGSLPALSPAASSSAESTNGDVSELSFEHPNVRSQQQQQQQVQAQAQVARPSTTSSNASSSNSNGKRVTRSTIRPNLRKDLGPSGASFSSAFGVGRSMNVHTTLIPELNFNFPIPPPSVFSSPPSLTDGTGSAPSSNTSQSGNSPLPSSFINNAGSNISSSVSVADMLAGKKDRDVAPAAVAGARLNMNPALNGLSQDQINNLREQFFASAPGFAAAAANSNNSANNSSNNNNVNVTSGKVARSPLDPLQTSFFDSNPFISLRQDNLQDYRAQLYAKLANNVAGIHQAQQQQTQQAVGGGGGGKSQSPVNGLKPAFFASPNTSQQQIQASSASSSSAASEIGKVSSKDAAEMAKIASIAQKTLFDKLSTAFWDAFSGSQHATPKGMVPAAKAQQTARRGSSASAAAASNPSAVASIDGQKVADVLAGRSRLQVVKNEQQEQQKTDEHVDELTKKIEGMGLKK